MNAGTDLPYGAGGFDLESLYGKGSDPYGAAGALRFDGDGLERE